MRPRPRTTDVASHRDVRLLDSLTWVRLVRARDYLAAHHGSRTLLEHGARAAALSPFHFSRIFTAAFGETPHEFVTRIRIDEAKKLLLAGNHSVTEICLEIGYESLGSFSTRFRSLTGLSPAGFRREARRFFAVPSHWPLLYIPACYQHFFLPANTARIEK